jgi:hypothetical protein
MKRFMCGLLVGLILSFTTPVLADSGITLFFNGNQIQNNDAVIANNRVMVPLRVVSETLGATVDWNASNRRVDIYQPDFRLILFPKPLTTTGPKIIGSDSFKRAVTDAMNLLARKAPEEYKLVNEFLMIIKEENSSKFLSSALVGASVNSTGECIVNWQAFSRVFRETNASNIEKSIILASSLTHEATHSYNHQRGLSNALSLLEHEILAYMKERQVNQKLNAPKFILNASDLNHIVDTNYYNTASVY